LFIIVIGLFFIWTYGSSLNVLDFYLFDWKFGKKFRKIAGIADLMD
jgi:hypothetical protein